MKKEVEELIKYRIKRSKETLKDAKILFEEKRLFSTVNRVYYAVFYIVNALLLTKELSSSKHSGVLSIFNREFIKKGLLDKELGKFYTKMFGFRQKADYKDMVKFKKEDVGGWLKSAEKFISEIEKTIKELKSSKRKAKRRNI